MQYIIKKRRHIATNDAGKRTVDEVKRHNGGTEGQTDSMHYVNGGIIPKKTQTKNP